MDTPDTPTTLQEAIVFFSNPDNYHAFMVGLRWPDGRITCPRCGSGNVKYLPNARVFKCFQKHSQHFHLFRYLDEQAFRFNNRGETDDSGRFVMAMRQAVGRRLTYKQLTGKTAEAGVEG